MAPVLERVEGFEDDLSQFGDIADDTSAYIAGHDAELRQGRRREVLAEPTGVVSGQTWQAGVFWMVPDQGLEFTGSIVAEVVRDEFRKPAVNAAPTWPGDIPDEAPARKSIMPSWASRS